MTKATFKTDDYCFVSQSSFSKILQSLVLQGSCSVFTVLWVGGRMLAPCKIPPRTSPHKGWLTIAGCWWWCFSPKWLWSETTDQILVVASLPLEECKAPILTLTMASPLHWCAIANAFTNHGISTINQAIAALPINQLESLKYQLLYQLVNFAIVSSHLHV